MFTVVIVEDEAIEREALKFIINKGIEYGVELIEVSTGSEAIRIINSMPIDLLLLDINIPYPNGLDVLRHLRAKDTNTKVIITTAIDDFEIARHMIALKVDDYLLKPIRPQILINRIKYFLDFDPEMYQQTKALSDYLTHTLENNLYAEWVQMIRDCINKAYLQKKSPSFDKIDGLVDVIKRIIDKSGWHVENLKKQAEQFKNTRPSKPSYYKVLVSILNLSNNLFDEAHRQINQTQEPMQKAFNYIERNLGKSLSLEEVAEKAHIAPSYLSRLFKKNAGINFVAYLKKRRIDIAKNLLNFSDMSIANIAIELSYNDPNYFGRAFKEETGLTPSEYRAQSKL